MAMVFLGLTKKIVEEQRRRRTRIKKGQKDGEEKGSCTNTKPARGDQLRNPIKVGHVSKCGAIPEVSNFLVKARKLPVSQLAVLSPRAALNRMSAIRGFVSNHPLAMPRSSLPLSILVIFLYLSPPSPTFLSPRVT